MPDISTTVAATVVAMRAAVWYRVGVGMAVVVWLVAGWGAAWALWLESTPS